MIPFLTRFSSESVLSPSSESRNDPSSKQRRQPFHVALLFNANKIYDREIIAGIGDYIRSTRVEWDLLIEDDFRARIANIAQWQGDGIIADYDDPSISEALAGISIPVVAVGGSYADLSDYPKGVPYVATDNFLIVKLAHDHLVEAGVQQLAMYSQPEAAASRWAQEREKAFARLAPSGNIYRGVQTNAVAWNTAIEHLAQWISSLSKPVGIIGITDARARHLMHACTVAGIAVPEQVAIVGIDNDPLTQSLTRIGLSSVRQGTHEMGRVAAQLLHQMLHGTRFSDKRVVVPPAGLNVQASSKHTRPFSALAMKARYYIRQYGCQGIKNEQVAEYAGVSRSTLEHCFRVELGSSVHRALMQHRLEIAQQLLRDTNLPAAEVAKRAGFTTPQYMHSVFKRELGITPTAIRRGASPFGKVS